MKKVLLNSIILLVLACAEDKAPDCIQTSGHRTSVEYSLEPFSKILVNENIELVIKEGVDFHISIEAGAHLISDISYAISDDVLSLTDHNLCNWIRSYRPTKITVTTPNLTEIRSNSQYTIKSLGVLTFQDLNLISENFREDQLSLGDFDLIIQAESLNVISNNLSQFIVSGAVDNLSVGFYSGTTAFFGANLLAQNVIISHRSSHDIIVHPLQSLKGELRGTGNLISVHTPAEVDVTQLYTGTLIFLD